MSKPEVVVITGASAGVGRATARAFAERGARIGLVARGRDGFDGARQDVEKAGGQALVVPTDVADAEQVEAAAEGVEQRFGPIDIWINNAMVSVFSPINEMTHDEFKRVTEVTYLGTVYVLLQPSSACCRAMRAWSFRSDLLSPIAAFLYRQPIAAPSTLSRDSTILCVASLFTTAARLMSWRCTCRR